ncbi:MAG: TRAP transporter substrate-binding protein [Acidaminococcales bacterium]|jgi:C4-dicarboxylate-binding protein DctP|nr:TRAP transporter substrate-binding protein [Acidaminococcales bacterium]
MFCLRNNKFIMCALVMFLAALLTAGCGGAQKPAEKAIDIRWSYDMPANGTMSVVPETFKKLVDEDPELKGKVNVKLYPASQLYKPAEALDAVARGDVEMISLANWYLAAISPKVTTFDLPFLFNDVNSMNKFLTSDLAKEIWQPLEQKGIVCVAAAVTGPYSIITGGREVILPGDAKGMKVRSLGDGSLIWLAVGASPVDLPAGDIFIAMQRGMIDAADIGPISVKERNLFEVTKYYLDTFIHSTVITQLANKKFLDGVPANLKGKIMQHLKTAEKKHHDVVAEASKKDVEEIKQKGGKVHVLTEAERQVWLEAAVSVHEKLGKNIGEDFLNKVKASQKK